MKNEENYQPPTTYSRPASEEEVAERLRLVAMKMPPCPWCESESKRKGKPSVCSRHPNGDSAPSPPRRSPFSWASIAGSNPEPVEVSEHEGRPCVYTLGCSDPFFLDDPAIVLYVDEMERPKNLRTQAEMDEMEKQWRLRAGNSHRWRGPR